MKFALGFGAYIVAAFLTFGHFVNSVKVPPCDNVEVAAKIACQQISQETYVAAINAGVLVGMFWPVFWAARASIWITR